MFNEVKSVETLRNKDTEATLSKDFTALSKLWCNDGVIINYTAEPIIGLPAIENYYKKQSTDLKDIDITEYIIRFKELSIIDTYAHEWGFYSLKSIDKNTGKTFEEKGKLMRILKKEKNKWKFARVIYTR